MSKTRRSTEFKNQSRVIYMGEARAQRQASREAQMKRKKRSQKPKKQEETRGKRAIRRKRNSTRLFGALIVVLIIIALVFAAIHVGALIKEKNDALAQEEALKKEKAKLQEQLENADDPNAIEDEARSELKFIKPGEVLYMFSNDFNGGKDD
ncbi:MAG: septum formation initiator family protein [Eubacterium sp.]|nr:septum formation initiator family protein [Candidatus Colimonas fimequi]